MQLLGLVITATTRWPLLSQVTEERATIRWPLLSQVTEERATIMWPLLSQVTEERAKFSGKEVPVRHKYHKVLWTRTQVVNRVLLNLIAFSFSKQQPRLSGKVLDFVNLCPSIVALWPKLMGTRQNWAHLLSAIIMRDCTLVASSCSREHNANKKIIHIFQQRWRKTILPNNNLLLEYSSNKAGLRRKAF